VIIKGLVMKLSRILATVMLCCLGMSWSMAACAQTAPGDGTIHVISTIPCPKRWQALYGMFWEDTFIYHKMEGGVGGGGGGRLSNPGQTENDRNANAEAAITPCPNPEATAGTNPILIATGNKVESETDFVSGGDQMPLYLTRTYNNYWSGIGIFGKQWLSNFDYKLSFETSSSADKCYPEPGNLLVCSPTPTQPLVLWAHRPDGRRVKFNWNATANAWLEAKAIPVAKIVKNSDGSYTLTSDDNSTERYDNLGYVLELKNPSGIGWTFSYNNYYLSRVTHTSGRYIQFTWTGNQLTSVTDPAGNQFNYTYQSLGVANKYVLASTVRPGTPSTTITYFYEDARFPGALTGKAFNGVRYSTFAYDSSQRAISSKHAGSVDNHTLTYTGTYDAVTSVVATNALGKQTTFQFSGGNLTSVTGASSPYSLGTYKERTYDANGYDDLVVDNNGNATNFDYNGQGQLLQEVDAVGTSAVRTTQYTWDTSGDRVTKVTVIGVSETSYGFNADNRIASVTVKNLVTGSANLNQTRTTQYTYTKYANGLLASATVDGPRPGTGDATTLNYSAAGDLTSVSDAFGTAVTYSNYNNLGLPGRALSRTGVQRDVVYDGQGRVLSMTRTVAGVAATWSYAYDAAGLLSYEVTPDGERTDYTYGGDRRLYQLQRDAHSMVTGSASTEDQTFTYDAAGDITEADDWAAIGHYVEQFDSCLLPKGAPENTCDEPKYVRVWEVDPTITRSNFNDYDELSRIRAQRGNNGQNVRYAMDDKGNIKTTTDSLNRVSTLTYDALDRVLTSTDAAGGITRYAYGVTGRVASVTDPRGLVTSYTYDGFGQLWSQVSPDTGTTNFTYDAYGQRTSMTRAAGTTSAVTTTYSYDSEGRVISRTAGTKTQSITYDSCANGIGRVCTLADSTGSVAYTYTPTGKVATQSTQYAGGGTASFSYTYDSLDRVSSAFNVLSGVLTNYTYSYGRLSAVTTTINGVTSNVVTGMTYQPMGPIASWTYGNGLVRTQRFDLDGRVTSIGDNGVAQKLAFTYSGNNQITGITNARGAALTQSFNYDPLSRLTGAGRGDGVSEGFAYDADGNRQTYVKAGVTTTQNYATGSNRLVGNSNPSLSRIWAYDAFGNSTGFTGADGLAVGLSYNSFNRLAASSRNSVTTNYFVNTLGQRVGKQTGAAISRYVYDPDGNLIAEFNGSTWTDYIRINGEAVGLVRNNALYFIHNDQVGRPEVVTNTVKTVVWSASNYAFDRTITADSIGGLNIGFPGQYFDQETGTWYNGFRDYDATVGRYIQSDPIGLTGGINSYAYVSGMPLIAIDRLGLCSDYWSRVWDDFHHLNDWIPGAAAFPGTGLLTGAGSAVRNTTGLPTALDVLKQWFVRGSFPMDDLSIEGGQIVWGVSAEGAILNFGVASLAVAGAWEGGIFLGSMESEALNDRRPAIENWLNDHSGTPGL
jgi:RHS repeat-associated protein